MAFVEIWSYVTLAVTLLMFMTGIPPCVNMYRTKSTANVPYHVFLLSALGCQGMFHYGIMIDNNILIFLNGIGLLMHSIYTVLYIVVSRAKVKSFSFLAAAAIYDSVLYAYMYKVVEDPLQRANVLGQCSGLLTTFMMTLPAFEVYSNIRNKNADGMPLVMLLGGLVCSTSWLIYGLMLNDPNIYSPNIPGITLTVAKLIIIWLYSDRPKDKKE